MQHTEKPSSPDRPSSPENAQADYTLDVSGKSCPVPVLKAKVAFKKLKPGETLEVITTDPGSSKDIPAWAEKVDARVLDVTVNGTSYRFLLQKRLHPVESRKIGEVLVEEGRVSTDDVEQALTHRKRIGQLLVELKKVDQETLDRVLAQQDAESHIRRLVGELLVEEGYLTTDDLRAALKQQKRTGELLVESGKVDSYDLLMALSHQHEEQVRRRRRSMVLVCSKGTLDMAYPPLILAATGAAMDMDVTLFFTFTGLDVINRHKVGKLKLALMAMPSQYTKTPFLLKGFPGITALATQVFKNRMKSKNVPDVLEFIRSAKEAGVKFIACQMTMDVMGVEREDLLDEVEDVVGAATMLGLAQDADITLFI